MGIPWDGMGWDGTGMNCYKMGWDGAEKYVPRTSLRISQVCGFSHEASVPTTVDLSLIMM